MPRGVGEAAFVSRLPEEMRAIAGAVTQLGDMWFVLTGIALVYVVSEFGYEAAENPRKDALYLFALAVGAYCLTVAMKAVFALPRPPDATAVTPPAWIPVLAGPVCESMVTAEGYGFPSGHALKTAAVYGGAAITLRGWNRSRRVLAAGAVTVLVSVSRVVLGVHYLVDVVVGTVVGVAFLGTVARIAGRDPTRALLIATGIGLLAFAMSPGYKTGFAVGGVALALGMAMFTDRKRPATYADRNIN